MMNMNDDPKWHEKAAKREAESPSGVFVPLTWRCQFCEQSSFADSWKNEICPKCGKKYDAVAAQDSEE